MKWIETTVGEFCPFIYGKGLTKTERKKGNVPVYGSNGCVDFHSESHTKGPGIVIGRKGSVGAVHLSTVPFWPIDTSFYIEKETLDELKFTYYLLKSLGLEDMNSDSAVPGLNRENAHSLVVNIPERIEDRELLGRWISKYDDKIERNRQTNQTIENIAQAIFKSWFVDFEPTRAKIAAKENGQDPERAAMAAIAGKPLDQLDTLSDKQLETLKTTAVHFPDKLVESELGGIPEGWGVKPLSQMVELIGGGTPKKSEDAYWNGDISWFSVKDAPVDGDVFVIDTEAKITELGLNKSSTKLLPEGVTIISARGTVGRLALVGIPTAMNQSCYGVKGAGGVGAYLNYFNLKEAVSTLQQNTHGAVFDTITRDTFDTVNLVEASEELQKAFETLVTAKFEKIKNNLFEKKSLEQLRDTLLPKLLSGELSIDSEAAA